MAQQQTPGNQHNDWGKMVAPLAGHPEHDEQARQSKEGGQDAAAGPLDEARDGLQQLESHRHAGAGHADTDGLKDKKPEELTAEELRLMADTMPGEGPGD